MKRPDLFLLIRKSVTLGLKTAICPSAPAFLSLEAIREFKREGVAELVIRMDDGATPPFDCAMDALLEAARIGLPTHVQTTVTRWNMYELDETADRVEKGQTRIWSLFLDDLTGDEFKEVFEDLYRISKRIACDVRVAERTYQRAPSQTAEARGFVFVSFSGEIHPSGFQAVSAGNVRNDSLVEAYRNSNLFHFLRDADQGQCRSCEQRRVCVGSRARAYALTSPELTR